MFLSLWWEGASVETLARADAQMHALEQAHDVLTMIVIGLLSPMASTTASARGDRRDATIGSLFSGIGGLSRPRVGWPWPIVFRCEVDAFCRAVLGRTLAPACARFEDAHADPRRLPPLLS